MKVKVRVSQGRLVNKVFTVDTNKFKQSLQTETSDTEHTLSNTEHPLSDQSQEFTSFVYRLFMKKGNFGKQLWDEWLASTSPLSHHCPAATIVRI